VTVNASTKIKRDDAPALFSDLQIGDAVSAGFNRVTLVANEIEVENEGGDDHGNGGGGGEKD
jgi:hypothetical protein